KMLQDNLSELRQAAQPDPAVQELTVYGLADIAYERGDYAMAHPRIRGALQAYPQSGNALRARNQLALRIWGQAIEQFRTLSIYELHAIRQVWHCQYYYFKDDAKAIDQLTRLRDAMDKLPEAAFDSRSDMHQRNYWIEKIVEMGKSMNK